MGSEVPERKIGDGHDKTLHFDYTNADTYSRDTGGQPLPTIESIYAMHAQNTSSTCRARPHERVLGQQVARLGHYESESTSSRAGPRPGSWATATARQQQGESSSRRRLVPRQPPGVWSVCLGEKGDLQGKEEDSGLETQKDGSIV